MLSFILHCNIMLGLVLCLACFEVEDVGVGGSGVRTRVSSECGVWLI